MQPDLQKRRATGLTPMHGFCGPNVICFSRSSRPPFPGLLNPPSVADDENADEGSNLIGAGNKGTLKGFSVRSSLNLSRLLSSLDWCRNGPSLHVTLTYHLAWPPDRGALDRAKMSLVQALGRHVACGIWRLEFQNRKGGVRVPHWHCLVWLGERDPGAFVEWLRAWWSGCSGNASRYGVHVSAGHQARGTWYLAMHAGKRSQAPLFEVGRWWGYVNRAALLSSSDLHKVDELGDRQRVWWARLYRRATGSRTRNAGGFTWFLPRAWQCVARSWVLDTCERESSARLGRLVKESVA